MNHLDFGFDLLTSIGDVLIAVSSYTTARQFQENQTIYRGEGLEEGSLVALFSFCCFFISFKNTVF